MPIALREAKVFSSLYIFSPHTVYASLSRYSEAEVKGQKNHNSRPSGAVYLVIITIIITELIDIVGH